MAVFCAETGILPAEMPRRLTLTTFCGSLLKFADLFFGWLDFRSLCSHSDGSGDLRLKRGSSRQQTKGERFNQFVQWVTFGGGALAVKAYARGAQVHQVLALYLNRGFNPNRAISDT
jgi:hypothetical protein